MNKSFWVGFGLALLLVLVGIFSFFGFYKGNFFQNQKNHTNDYYIITNQIEKLNKMVVLEQNSSSMQRTKISRQIFGKSLPGTEKSMITLTRTLTQASFDLNQMKIEVDSTQRKMVISYLPPVEIKVIPSVEIQSMEESLLSDFDEQEIKKITQEAKEKAIALVDRKELETKAKIHLRENLQQIFVLAKTLGYTIEDKTQSVLF